MKVSSFLFISIFILVTGCKTLKPSADIYTNNSNEPVANNLNSAPSVNFSDPATWLLGYFNRRQFVLEPHSQWFYKGYDSYQPTPDAIDKLSLIKKDGLTIKIVMGTWCPDSRREVPRFMKILDTWQFPPENVTFIGVDDYKISPVGKYEQLNIIRVPTFIVYKNNIEAGRIIENPITSLEQDIVNILTRNEK